MRDEKNSSGKNPGAELSAADLLARLKQSYDDAGEKKKERPDSTAKSYDKSLTIDDGVYRAAEERLRTSEAVTAKDDSDLDIDELIDMYITKPREEREALAAEQSLPPVDENGDNIVREITRESEDEFKLSFDGETEVREQPEAESFDNEPIQFESADEAQGADEKTVQAVEAVDSAETEEAEVELDDDVAEPDAVLELEMLDGADEAVEEALEPTAQDAACEAVLQDEPQLQLIDEGELEISSDAALVPCADVEDSDMKLAEAVGMALSDEEVSEHDEIGDLDAQTAVFDIALVKQMAEQGEGGLEAAIDEAFEKSETEIFTPVCGDEDSVQSEQDTKQDGDLSDEAEIDQDDLHILLAFGMEEELEQTVGAEKAAEIEEDIIQKHERTVQMGLVADQIEYTTRDQNEEIINGYESRYKSLLIRMAAAVALLVGMFFIENFSVFGLSLPEFMSPTFYPVVYAMIDLQLVVFSAVLVYKQVIAGGVSLVKGKMLPETVTAFMLALSAIYTLAAGFTAPVDGFRLYNLPVVLTVLLTLIYEFMNLRREVYSFNVVSSAKKKFVVTHVSEESDALERDIFIDYVPGQSQIIRVDKTDFVDGFFDRSEAKKVSKPIIGIMIPIICLAALVFAVLSVVGGSGTYGALTMAFLTVVLSAPLTLFVIYSYPFYKASKDSFDRESAIIGETSLSEYSTSSVISFEDKEVFPSKGVKVTSIKVFGQNRIDEIIYNAASAFIKVGGPLADVFSQATHDMGYSQSVELVEVDDDGFTVTVDGELVYIGKSSYMEKKDYDPPFDSEERKQEQSPNVGALFIAFRGQLTAKIYVAYTIDREFEKILAQLYKTGMCVGIKSFDPNIDDLLLAKTIKAMKYPVKVIRAKNVDDIPHTTERCESGVVSKRSVKALLRTVALCERVSSVIKTNLVVGIISMIIGAGIMVFVHLFDLAGAFPSLYALLYQLFWLIPVAVISRLLV